LAVIAHLAELPAVIVTVVDVSGLFVRIGIMVVEILVAGRAVVAIALVGAVLEKGGICAELALIIAEAKLVGRRLLLPDAARLRKAEPRPKMGGRERGRSASRPREVLEPGLPLRNLASSNLRFRIRIRWPDVRFNHLGMIDVEAIISRRIQSSILRSVQLCPGVLPRLSSRKPCLAIGLCKPLILLTTWT